MLNIAEVNLTQSFVLDHALPPGDESVLLLPIFVMTVSLVFLGLQQSLEILLFPKRLQCRAERLDSGAPALAFKRRLGGPVIITFQFARLICCIALLGLSVYTEVSRDVTATPTFAEIGLCATYLYASLLAITSLITSAKLRKRLSQHLVLLLLTTWAVFAYRDVWPLLTFTLVPLDQKEGCLLWAKLSVLTTGAILVPGFMPRQYVPIDEEEPMEKPNAEQTAPFFSMVVYAFLDGVVLLANKVPHLSLDELPPLADTSRTKILMKSAQPHLDPLLSTKRTHIFWKLMWIYRFEYTNMAAMLIIRLFTTIAAPIGINRLLTYLETGGKHATVRPWVWVVMLFLSPTLTAIAVQWYEFMASRMLVHAEATLTQTIFDHALRIRIKAEKPKMPSGNNDMDANTSTDNSASDHEQAENLAGRLNNLITSDISTMSWGRDFLCVVLYAPLQSVICIWLLYALLGWSAFVGVGVMLIGTPLLGFLAKLMQKYQIRKMEKADARVQSVTEAINVMRMIKLFGWEKRTSRQLTEKRDEELVWYRKERMSEIGLGIISFLIPLLTMISTFATYTVIMKQPLTASRVFSATTVFEMFRNQSYGMVFYMVPVLIKAKVALDRINDFLQKTELIDQFSSDDGAARAEHVQDHDFSDEDDRIGIKAAKFTWSIEQHVALTSEHNFVLNIPDELIFQNGCINLIIGPTGSGKTSLLMALLGELHYIPLAADSFCHLPRKGGVAYAAQESWILNESIRDNILFGASYDEERYNKVIRRCALVRDLSLFKAGDRTEVGEKGVTLSGGQKARITLARAVYSSAQILLLDDVFAALDVHTSRSIIDDCFKSDLIRGRTVILVTHNIALTSDIAVFIVSLGSDGRIAGQGSLSRILDEDQSVFVELAQESRAMKEIDLEAEDLVPQKLDSEIPGKLMSEEEVSLGHVTWPALMMFFSNLGGRWSFGFWTMFCGAMFCCYLGLTFSTWFLGYWAQQYEHHQPSEVPVSFFLDIYGLLLLSNLFFATIAYGTYIFGSINASGAIHKMLVDSVLGATLRWLDTTPMSRIITRFTQDIQTVDHTITQQFQNLTDMVINMAVQLGGIVVISPMFIIPGSIIALVGALCGQIYMRAQLPVKREMSNARAPVLGHFSAAVAGLTSIRAYGAQSAFRQESYKRIDEYSRAARTFYNLNLWIDVRIEALGGLFVSSLAAYLVYIRGARSSNTGFSLNMAVTFSGSIFRFVRNLNDFEVSSNSLERIMQYTQIEQEPKSTEGGIPPAYWPASGDLRVEKLSARYSKDGPEVLHGISFSVKSGERVGIVGRTGSGKSSLTLSLLRCLHTEGKIYYDGLPIDTLNLDAVRSKITIIPQVPELMTGTLRQNLDPFSECDDAVLNDALRAAGLFSLHGQDTERRIGLYSHVSSGGGNLSVGQRQILALARAIVRQSKLLILDEATSAIDYETDAVIQRSLREDLAKDVTLLIVAHRLQTVMDADKIMVLEAGRIVEFGEPRNLLKDERGALRALVDESMDKNKLYAMANL